METLSKASGIGEPALRLLFSLLAAFPIAVVQKYVLLPLNNVKATHLFNFLSGLSVCFFFCGFDSLHSLFTVIATYYILEYTKKDRRMGLYAAFTFNFGYLLICYAVYSTYDYDIDFTTPQSVLCLRLIGFAFDLFDGDQKKKAGAESKPAKAVVRAASAKSTDVDNSLVEQPDILSVLGYTYYAGGFFVGPQFSFKLYNSWVTREMYQTADQKEVKIPDSSAAFAKIFGQAVIFLLLGVVSDMFPVSLWKDPVFWSNQWNFFSRAFYVWFSGNISLFKYVGVWKITEASCILSGLAFSGYDDKGQAQWSGLTNLDWYLFITTPNLDGVIESFNINTNNWAKIYIYKRCIWMKNRNLSSLTTLLFLATWHGYAAGYFYCFLLEFITLEAQKRLVSLVEPLVKVHVEQNPDPNAKKVWYVVCWLVRTLTIAWGMMPFHIKGLSETLSSQASLYYIGHILIVVIFVIYEGKALLFGKPAEKPRTPVPAVQNDKDKQQ
eukprot:TRINITY_DN3943_c0_g1_i1.p1 TRINITY_DN3943_c0_g1~~TRINITY_DN3943_c0_g1_i1.p1  ORF type:complete len:495 (-),score=104.64 TRINITY_DN3943_c0_g1_i1:105-1589(-)